MYELNGSYKSLLSKAGFFDDNITPEKASDIFLTKFEGAWAQQAKEREGYASSFYNTKGVSAGKPSCNGDGNGGSTSSSDTSSYTGGTTSDGQTNAVINNVVTTHTNIEVVLTDETTFDEDGNPITYYPITVLDRVLSVKDAVLNVLENSEYIQSEMASRGLTYDAQTNTTSTGNWVWDETQGKYVLSGTNGFNTDEMVNYVSTTIKDVTSYGAITELTDGTFAIGIGSWTGEDAKALLKEIISKNPDAYRRICQSNGISEIDFTTNWSSTKNSDYSKISSVISSLLTLEGAKSIQDDKFNAKVETVVNYMIGNHITDSATLAFLSSIAMYFDDISKLGSAGGDMAMFREYVMNASITAGSDNSFQMAFEAAFKWVGDSGNTYASPAIKTKISEYYSTIKAAKENGTLPKMYTQGLAENVEPIIDMATTFAGDDYFPYFHYSTYTADNCKKKSGQQHTLIARQSIQTIASNMQSIYDSQSGYISGDCSSFVAALFYNFGYNVPTSSGAWKGNSYGYKEFTDSSQLQPGDVIVWRTPGSSTGHVELYIGNGASIGFGSEPVTIHSNWNCFNGYQTVSFYRVID
jgi:hypothetical protein